MRRSSWQLFPSPTGATTCACLRPTSPLDGFWRTRSWSDMSQLPRERRDKVLPYIRAWAEAAAGFSGLEVYRGFSQIGEIRSATLSASRAYDFLLSPTAALPAFAAELASPLNDPGKP